jgi:hypothetical protein
VKGVQNKTRRATTSTAAILEEFELRQPKIVTGELLDDVLMAAGSHLGRVAAAERLVREGWLVPLRTRAAWEFVPAARAGRYPSGDPWIELRAYVSGHPDAPIAVAFSSAVWAMGYSSHQPERLSIAHRGGWRRPKSLRDAQSILYEWRLPTWTKDGLSIWHPATIVVAAAARPSAHDDWANADEWLPETMRATTPDDVLTEAEGKSAGALARLAYFAEWSGRHDIVEALTPFIPRRLPVTFLGPETRSGRRWVKRWRIYDSLLPTR